MTALGIIPARFAATRFPGKPLTPIAGKPMIQWVWEGAQRAQSLRAVCIATDDERIAQACRGFGAEVVMTRADHPTGTDRLAEAAARFDDAIVVNVQGDEPLIEGFVIDAVVRALETSPHVSMSTVVHAAQPSALHDPNRVKVVMDNADNALYFSRSPIPYARNAPGPDVVWQHVGLYAYRRDFLFDFVKLTPGRLEQCEALEQLRALENGYAIRCAVIEGWESVSVDTPADVDGVIARLARRGDVARG